IDANMPIDMDDMVVRQDNAHVVDLAFHIVEKGQIPGLTFLNETQGLALSGLPMGLPFQGNSIDSMDHLGKAGAIDAEGSPSPCKKGGLQIEKGRVHHPLFWAFALLTMSFKVVVKKGRGPHHGTQRDRNQHPVIITYMGKEFSGK